MASPYEPYHREIAPRAGKLIDGLLFLGAGLLAYFFLKPDDSPTDYGTSTTIRTERVNPDTGEVEVDEFQFPDDINIKTTIINYEPFKVKLEINEFPPFPKTFYITDGDFSEFADFMRNTYSQYSNRSGTNMFDDVFIQIWYNSDEILSLYPFTPYDVEDALIEAGFFETNIDFEYY